MAGRLTKNNEETTRGRLSKTGEGRSVGRLEPREVVETPAPVVKPIEQKKEKGFVGKYIDNVKGGAGIVADKASEKINKFSEDVTGGIKFIEENAPVLPKTSAKLFEKLTPFEQKEIDTEKDYTKKRTALDSVKDVMDEPHKLVPFMSSAPEATYYSELLEASKNIDKLVGDDALGEKEQRQLDLINDFINKSEQDSTFASNVIDIVSGVPAFAGELFATGGTATATKEATKKMIQKTLTKELKDKVKSKVGKKAIDLAEKGVATAVSEGARLPVAGAPRIVANTLKEQVPTFGLETQEDGTEVPFIAEEGKDLGDAFTSAITNQYIELVSERSGALIPKLPKGVTSKIMESSLVKKIAELNPGIDKSKLTSALNKMGWNGIVGEVFEERVGDVMRGVTTELGLTDEEFSWPTAEEWATEFVAFAIPGAGIAGLNVLAGEKKEVERRDAPEVFQKKNPVEAINAVKDPVKRIKLLGKAGNEETVETATQYLNYLENYVSPQDLNVVASSMARDLAKEIESIIPDQQTMFQSDRRERSARYLQTRDTIHKLLRAKDNAKTETARKRLEKEIGKLENNLSKYQLEDAQEVDNFINQDRVFQQIKDIPFLQNVEVKKVKEIVTRDGGRAFGSYLDGVVKYIDNPLETTIPHEAFHAFFDMAITTRERDAILTEVRDLYPTSTLSELEAEEKLADLAGKYFNADAKGKKAILDQFNTDKEGRTFLQKIFDKIASLLKDLRGDIDTVQSVLNSFATKKGANRYSEVQKEVRGIREAFLENPDEFTIKLFKNKEFSSRRTSSYEHLSNLLKSINPKKGERLIVESVLNSPQFKDERVINLDEFSQAIKAELLVLNTIENDSHADYGMDALGYNPDINTKPATVIINTNFNHGATGHFSNAFDVVTTKDDLEILTKDDKYVVRRKGITAGSSIENVYETFNTSAEAQEYVNTFADRRTKDAGMLSHYRKYTEDNIDHVVELQSDVFQSNLTHLLRSNEKLRLNELKNAIDRSVIYFRQEKMRISHYKKRGLESLKKRLERELENKEDPNADSKIKDSRENLEGFQKAYEEKVKEITDNVNKKYGVEEGYYFRKETERIIDHLEEKIESLEIMIQEFESKDNTIPDLALVRVIQNLEDSFYSEKMLPIQSKLFDPNYDPKGSALTEVTDEKKTQNLLKLGKEALNVLEESKFEFEKKRSEITKEQLEEINKSNKFIDLRNIWPDITLKQAIRSSAMSGKDKMRFATPLTVSKVEGWMQQNSFDGGETQYREGDLTELEEIEFLGAPGVAFDVNADGYEVIYNTEGGEIKIETVDDIDYGRRDHHEGSVRGGHDITDFGDSLDEYLKDKGLSDAKIKELKNMDLYELSEQEETSSFVEDYVESEVEALMDDQTAVDWMEEIYGDGSVMTLTSFGQEYVVFSPDGSILGQEIQGWPSTYDGEDVDFIPGDYISDPDLTNIANKYGEGGVFHKSLVKAVGKDNVKRVTDSNGNGWWEVDIKPEHKDSIELYQKIEESESERRARIARMLSKTAQYDETMTELEVLIDESDTYLVPAKDQKHSGHMVRTSTFPKWIPSHLRSRKMMKRVYELLEKNQAPHGNSTRQNELFDVFSDFVASRVGLTDKDFEAGNDAVEEDIFPKTPSKEDLAKELPKGKAIPSLSPKDFVTETEPLSEEEAKSLEEVSQENIVDSLELYSLPLKQIIEEPGTPVNKKTNLLDYLRTPDRVLKKLGLDKEMRLLRQQHEGYLQELPKNIDVVSEWGKRMKAGDNEKIFTYLDGQNKGENLSEEAKEIAEEIRAYLLAWADRLNIPVKGRISNYITHIFEDQLIQQEFDEDLAKIISDKVAGSVYNPFLQKRLGAKGYKQDTLLALDAYTKRATRKAYMDPALEILSERAGSLELSQWTYVKSYVDRINMRPTDLDNLVDNTVKSIPWIGYKVGQRPVSRLSSLLRRMTYRAMLGLNLGSALRNLSQGANTFAKLGVRDTFTGYINLFKKGSVQELHDQGILLDNFIQDRVLSSFKKKLYRIDKALWVFFDTAEKINRGSAYHGMKAKLIRAGKSEREAIDGAKKLVRDTQFLFGSIDTPLVLSSDVVKTLNQFGSFTVKQMEFLGEMMQNKEYAGLMRYALAGMFYVMTVGRLFGMRPEELIPWFRFDTPASLKFPWEVAKVAVDAPDAYGQSRDGREKFEDVMKSLIGLIPAGTQAKKTIQGYDAWTEGASYNKANQLQFKVDTSPVDGFKLMAFGKWATPQAKEYFNRVDKIKNEKKEMMPTYEDIKELAIEGKKDEAREIYNNLTKNEKRLFKAIKSDEKRKETLDGKRNITPVVYQLRDLVLDGKKDEAREIYNNLSKKEMGYFKLVKKDLEKEKRASQGMTSKWSDGDVYTEDGVIGLTMAYAKALLVDPVSAFTTMFSEERLNYVANDAVIMVRLPLEDSQAIRKELGADDNVRLDHIVPLQLGGDNSDKNLQLVPTAVWKNYTPIENYIGRLLRDGKIKEKEAQNLIKDFKSGLITAEEIFSKEF